MNYKLPLKLFTVVLFVSVIRVRAEDKVLEGEFRLKFKEASEEFRKDLPALLKKETTHVIVKILDERKYCADCLSEHPIETLKSDSSRDSNSESPAKKLVNVTYSSKKDKVVLDEFFKSFSSKSAKKHDTDSIMYNIVFMNGEEWLYDTTYSIKSNTLDFLVPSYGSYSISSGMSLAVSDALKNAILVIEKSKKE